MHSPALPWRLGALGSLVAVALSLGVVPAQAEEAPSAPLTTESQTVHTPPAADGGAPVEPKPFTTTPGGATPRGGPSVPSVAAPDQQGPTVGRMAAVPLGSLTGRVVVPPGVDPTELNVGADSLDVASVTPAADGAFALDGLEEGDHTLWVDPGATGLAWASYPDPRTWTSVHVTGGAVTSDVEITLVPSGAFAGTVSSPSGPVAGAWVTAVCAWSGNYSAETDAQGRYRIAGVPREACRLYFSAPPQYHLVSGYHGGGLSYLDGTGLVAQPGATVVVDEVLAPSAVITGRVVGPDGAPRADVWVVALGTQAWSGASTDADGRYAIDYDLAAGDYKVHFLSTTDEPLGHEYFVDGNAMDEAMTVSVGAGQTRPGVDAQLEPGTRVRLTVTGADGSPAPYVTVEPVGVAATPAATNNFDTFWGDADGSVDVLPLRAGSTRFAFGRASGDTPYVGQYYATPTTTSSTVAGAAVVGLPAYGDVAMTARLRTGASITGTVAAPAGGSAAMKRVVAFRDDATLPSRSALTDQDGHYTIQGLLPGTYYVAVAWSGVDARGLFYRTGTKPAQPNVTVTGTTTTSGIDITGGGRFVDVQPATPFSADISWLSTQGITQGSQLADGTLVFDSAGPVRREAMAAFLYRAAGRPPFTEPVVSPFVDVAPGAPFYKEICWLASTGISTGTDVGGGRREFRPAESVSREAMAAFLYRFKGSPAFTIPSPAPFVDVATGDRFPKEIAWLASVGISTGTDIGGGAKEYRPAEPVRRDAMAAFLHRASSVPGMVG
ncbi:S-layer homology domain-containing protein [Cellulomonas sp.]|uniref:S-layer homology domain-containing protein n=1 Tax=Cellulomonas sp. TaxID=40001 RepID=UPI001B1DD4CE|nr:S-layer homology domain-containing protein [Cellulomonas sp.]MBO9555749.1 carboxypeptidase regulatory-like domain-containing protein [Cellulomonas sp.]